MRSLRYHKRRCAFRIGCRCHCRHWRNHRQPPDKVPDQPERFQVLGLHSPQQPISNHLVSFGQLIASEPAPNRLTTMSSRPTNAQPPRGFLI
jgi:hypothetical protein